ncbi:hypothetical protein NQ176_g10737 [Zarea fungicola]|uniref:Uncharacterized protein n=1 Tax=Zarea fungicola TaxID=93591 RepID=A0ACC1MEC7_9HYPO|nr:hypothetical protein NQ176_g10737 [Lecanicillium fungicola]
MKLNALSLVAVALAAHHAEAIPTFQTNILDISKNPDTSALRLPQVPKNVDVPKLSEVETSVDHKRKRDTEAGVAPQFTTTSVGGQPAAGQVLSQAAGKTNQALGSAGVPGANLQSLVGTSQLRPGFVYGVPFVNPLAGNGIGGVSFPGGSPAGGANVGGGNGQTGQKPSPHNPLTALLGLLLGTDSLGNVNGFYPTNGAGGGLASLVPTLVHNLVSILSGTTSSGNLAGPLGALFGKAGSYPVSSYVGNVNPGLIGLNHVVETGINGLQGVVNTGVSGLNGVVNTGVNGVTGVVGTGINGLKGLGTGSETLNTGVSGLNGILDTGVNGLNGILSTGVNGLNGILATGVNGLNGIVNTGVNGVNTATANDGLAHLLQELIQGFGSIGGRMVEVFSAD